eukprot:scaffold19044_cov67-Cyclotella_meneghiniana.AAC.1
MSVLAPKVLRTMNLLGKDLSMLPQMSAIHQQEVTQAFTAAQTLLELSNANNEATDSEDDADTQSQDSSISDVESPDEASCDEIDDPPAAIMTLYDPADEGRISDIHNVFRRDIYEGFIVPPGARYAGTVAFRCRHCKHLPAESRAAQSWVFPRTIEQMYRAHIRFNREHYPYCEGIPKHIRAKVAKLKRSSCRGSKSYWVTSARKKGLKNGRSGIVLCDRAM